MPKKKKAPEKKKKKRGKGAGRPSKMNASLLAKLEHAFSIGANDIEACLYADINPSVLYNYQKKKPEFTKRKMMLKQKPVLKARQTIYKGLDSPEMARWFMERKRKDEFSTKHINVNQNLDGMMTEDHKKKVQEILEQDDEEFDPDIIPEDKSEEENEDE